VLQQNVAVNLLLCEGKRVNSILELTFGHVDNKL